MLNLIVAFALLSADQQWKDELVGNINALRETPLRVDSTLEAAAQDYADILAATGKEGHEANGDVERRILKFGFDGTIRAPGEWGMWYFDAVARKYKRERVFGLGEVLGHGQPNHKEALRCWMESKGHREAILEPTYDSCGFAYAEWRGKPIWVGTLGKARLGNP